MTTGGLRWLAIAAVIVLYALLVHHSNASHIPALGAALAITPPLIALLLLSCRSSRPLLYVGALLLLGAAVLLRWWPQIELRYSLLYLMQDCGLYLALAIGFGRSLLSGQEPLCTQWAQRLRGPLPEDVRDYTRAVTLAWTLFFIGISGVSIALYLFAPLQIWSVYSNFLTLPLVLLMFILEHAVRHRRVPSLSRISVLDTMRAYVDYGRGGSPQA